ncbi:MAG: tRNA pseudouridine(13) synthase TruD, partial [Thermoplasmatota archaeon]
MKVKQQPSDFIVEEITTIKFSTEKDAHQIFIMEKKEQDTFEAIDVISRTFHIPKQEIGYAGLKDKHAITSQYISIPSNYVIVSAQLKYPILHFQGYHQKKLYIGDLQGNRFTITIRDLTQKKLKQIKETSLMVQTYGVPNYFDSQRFGSVIHNEFIMRYILQNNYEKAMRIFLTFYEKFERKIMKDDKRTIENNWEHLEKVRIRNNIFQQCIKEYLQTQSWHKAYLKIPHNIRELHKNAFQSYLWNECIKELMKQTLGPTHLFPVKYHVGTLLFFQEMHLEQEKSIPRTFKTISNEGTYSTPEKNIIDVVLSKQGIRIS